jgi:hypothetical protein
MMFTCTVIPVKQLGRVESRVVPRQGYGLIIVNREGVRPMVGCHFTPRGIINDNS